jgi:hypothetical protein
MDYRDLAGQSGVLILSVAVVMGYLFNGVTNQLDVDQIYSLLNSIEDLFLQIRDSNRSYILDPEIRDALRGITNTLRVLGGNIHPYAAYGEHGAIRDINLNNLRNAILRLIYRIECDLERF